MAQRDIFFLQIYRFASVPVGYFPMLLSPCCSLHGYSGHVNVCEQDSRGCSEIHGQDGGTDSAYATFVSSLLGLAGPCRHSLVRSCASCTYGFSHFLVAVDSACPRNRRWMDIPKHSILPPSSPAPHHPPLTPFTS